jgi:putative hydrolase of the HAD superfamily
MSRTRQHLIIDADDTLWENNIYFERAFEEFVQFLDHSTLSPAGVRSILDEIELANARIHGYGSTNFGRNMKECYRRLVEREIAPGDLEQVMSFAERILGYPIEMISGVPETLEYLYGRHDLVLFTKGHPEEQKLKIDRSGLGIYFHHTAIVKEKDPEAYRSLVTGLGFEVESTWMVGNSPKSDINPALAIGLNAVFIPHVSTWTLEREQICRGAGQLLLLESFRELREHF